MKILYYVSLFFTFISISFATDKPMDVDDLVSLCIDQANYHRNEEPQDHVFAQRVKTIYDQHKVSESWNYDLRYPEQVPIPLTLFTPNVQHGNAILIHTHGGPSSHLRKDTFHAECGYFMDNGIPVVAHNYRGSTGFGDRFKAMADGKNPIWGIQDLYTVARTLKSDKNILILRGGSYGSCISSHALKMHAHEQIFAAAHFAGGTKYPYGEEMPRDVPLLIAHGLLDDIVPFEIGARFALQMLYAGYTNVQFIGAEFGDHHMISTMLNQPVDCIEMKELTSYLFRSTSFVHAIAQGQAPPKDNTDEQIEQIEKLLMMANKIAPNNAKIKKNIHQKKQLMPMLAEFAPLLFLSEPRFSKPDIFVGPTMSHLKLVMGEQYYPNVDHMLRGFFYHHFRPIDWPSRDSFDTQCGLSMMQDQPFMDQCREMIYAEEDFIRSHPDHMVIYHTAPEDSMRFYLCISMWRALLQGKSATEIRDFRLFDSLGASFADVDEFLIHMHAQERTKKGQEEIFNNVKGFSKRAIAGVPFLTASRYNKAACSLFWHYKAASPNIPPYEKVLAQLFKVMGIHSNARVSRYQELFELDQAEVKADNAKQSVMQQIFVPHTYVDQQGYNCQIWGLEHGKSCDNFRKPSIIRELQADPIAFEAKLRENKRAFTNPEEIQYGSEKVLFSDLMQLRMIVRPEGITRVNSFLRSKDHFDRFAQRLQKEILWDFADFIVAGKSIPKVLLPDAIDFSSSLRERLAMNTEVAEYTPYIRFRIFKALLNPERTLHGLCSKLRERLAEVGPVLVGAAQDEILECQKILMKDNLDEMLRERPTYGPCYYLQGYTYYSLLMEAIETKFTNHPNTSYPANMKALHKGILVGAIEMFADSRSGKEKYINCERYAELVRLCDSILGHARDQTKHRFFQRSSQGQHFEGNLWAQELKNATLSFLNNARKAKDSNNHVKAYKDKNIDFYYAVIEPLEILYKG